MSTASDPELAQHDEGNPRLALLLAMAMFVLVIDTSLMNVSISAVIKDLHTTASGVQSAIALEALVSAAFILTSSKLGDLMGRRRAYVIGLLGYAVGAVAMTVAQDLNTIIIFWAIVGGLGASLLLPAMQSLIHGNFTGGAQKRAYALVGAAAAIAAAVGPLLGGFLTTYLSWRVGFGLEALIILVVLSQIRLVKDVPYTGPRQIDAVGAILSIVGMGGLVLGILVWQEGGQYVGLIMGIGAATLAAFAYWLVWRKRHGKPTLLDPGLFKHLNFRIGISQQMLQQITLGGAMIALPLFLQMTLEYNAMEAGLSLAPLSLSMFGMAMLAGRKPAARPALLPRRMQEGPGQVPESQGTFVIPAPRCFALFRLHEGTPRARNLMEVKYCQADSGNIGNDRSGGRGTLNSGSNPSFLETAGTGTTLDQLDRSLVIMGGSGRRGFAPTHLNRYRRAGDVIRGVLVKGQRSCLRLTLLQCEGLNHRSFSIAATEQMTSSR